MIQLNEKIEVRNYYEVRNQFQTGHIMGFLNENHLVTKIIGDVTACPTVVMLSDGLSHTASLVRLDNHNGQLDRVWVEDSGLLTGGVKLRLFSERIIKHNGVGYWLPLNMTRTQKLLFEANAVRREQERIGYDLVGILEEALRLCGIGDGAQFHKKAIFCSGLTYESLIDVGVAGLPRLDRQPNPSELFMMLLKVVEVKPILLTMDRQKWINRLKDQSGYGRRCWCS